METAKCSKRIRAFRKLKGLTQHQLAEITGLSVTIIGELERGNRPAHQHVLQVIAKALEIQEKELLGS